MCIRDRIKSKIGAPVDQKRTLACLGLHKISQVVEVEDTPSNRGTVSYTHLDVYKRQQVYYRKS